VNLPERPAGAARVLHTSDWHLGVTCRGESRGRDHDAAIAQVVAAADAVRPDLILHTGDLFDGARPGYDDILRALLALRRLGEVAPVVVIAGNHDSEGLFRVLAEAFGEPGPGSWDHRAHCTQRVRLLGKPCLPGAGAVARYRIAEGPDIRLGCLPFVHANRLIKEFDELAIANATYAEKIRIIAQEITAAVREDMDPACEVAVWASHLHVEGARLSSERQIHVSADYAADPTHLTGYGYLAFGHIHRPQDLPGGRGRYAGSLLEVDFGEEAEDKVVVVADLEPATYPGMTTVPITAGRRLRRPRGTLIELAARADELGDAICEVTVEPDPDVNPSDDLVSLTAGVRAALPEATIVGVIDARRPAELTLDESAPAVGAEETVGQALRRYLAAEGAALIGQAEPDRMTGLFDELLAAVEIGDAPAISEDVRLDGLSRQAT